MGEKLKLKSNPIRADSIRFVFYTLTGPFDKSGEMFGAITMGSLVSLAQLGN